MIRTITFLFWIISLIILVTKGQFILVAFTFLFFIFGFAFGAATHIEIEVDKKLK